MTTDRSHVGRPKKFFEERQGAAVLKHSLLDEYLSPFVGMTGMNAPDGRVSFIDAYAGAGAYETGDPGSPLLAAAIAERLSKNRQLEMHLVEKDPAMFRRLEATFAGEDRIWTYKGTIEEHVDTIIELSDECPMLAMFDPFGLLLPMTFLTKHFMDRPRPHRHPPTELLITFVLPAVNRTMGWLRNKSTSQSVIKRKASLLDRLDITFGGEWWRDVWLADLPIDDRNDRLVRGYLQHLIGPSEDWAWWYVGVSDEWEGWPVYFLLFLTQHPAGVWKFLEALSIALERHYDFTHRDRLDLDPLPDREDRWVREIKLNIVALLESKGAFRARAELKDVFGKALPYARGKHLRRAIKELYAEGKTSTDGVRRKKRGDPEIQDQLIIPP